MYSTYGLFLGLMSIFLMSWASLIWAILMPWAILMFQAFLGGFQFREIRVLMSQGFSFSPNIGLAQVSVPNLTTTRKYLLMSLPFSLFFLLSLGWVAQHHYLTQLATLENGAVQVWKLHHGKNKTETLRHETNETETPQEKPET